MSLFRDLISGQYEHSDLEALGHVMWISKGIGVWSQPYGYLKVSIIHFLLICWHKHSEASWLDYPIHPDIHHRCSLHIHQKKDRILAAGSQPQNLPGLFLCASLLGWFNPFALTMKYHNHELSVRFVVTLAIIEPSGLGDLFIWNWCWKWEYSYGLLTFNLAGTHLPFHSIQTQGFCLLDYLIAQDAAEILWSLKSERNIKVIFAVSCPSRLT